MQQIGHVPQPKNCPNCGAAAHGPYCSECGQETDIGEITLRQFGHEYLQTFVSLEGRLWRTLWLLISKPGQLTVEFVAGRRRRYVRPMPLYLSLSFLFFLVLTLSVGERAFTVVATQPSVYPVASNGQVGGNDPVAASRNDAPPQWLEPLVLHIRKASEQFKADPQRASKYWTTAFFDKLPYAMFFLIPAFALATHGVYRQRRRTYAVHLLFAMHLHSFAFVYLTLMQLVFSAALAVFLLPVWWLYLAVALHTVFAGAWKPQVLRALALIAGHFVLLSCAMVTLALLAFPSLG